MLGVEASTDVEGMSSTWAIQGSQATVLTAPSERRGSSPTSWSRSAHLNGAIEPGSAINQLDLAAEIGMSTTPLREALRRLSAESLVVLDAHKDATVAPLTVEEGRNIIEIRVELDALAVAGGSAANR